MHDETLAVPLADGSTLALPITRVHTLVVGSGAAGLGAAVSLHAHGITDLLILTEALTAGTSFNAGSDKQTYYKLGLYGDQADSPAALAETLFAGGSMHGDLALVEANYSMRAFARLLELGVSFPHDRAGGPVGYRTDHDPRQRATSVGPYTSREMCRALAAETRRRNIRVRERASVAALLTRPEGDARGCLGVLALLDGSTWHAYIAENVVWATGGPGGLYHASAYPAEHAGGIGIALLAGARARNLQESQFGLASVAHRWNVSGAYMQALPRFLATAADGASDAHEFLRPHFSSAALADLTFAKGYEWPFDARRALIGSSLIDMLVYQETVLRGRRVWLDYRANPEGLDLGALGPEARGYLERSGALGATPLARLEALNPAALAHYRAHGIDLATQPLEIAICAQHNNGGLAADDGWESENVRRLFPVGEVNGSHGVYRPGGAALNAGQVGGYRLAETIAARYATWTTARADGAAAAADVASAAAEATHALSDWATRARQAPQTWQSERDELAQRMSRAAGPLRRAAHLAAGVREARVQWDRVSGAGCRYAAGQLGAALTTRQLVFAQLVYLEACAFAAASGVGSRGSALALGGDGARPHPLLGAEWGVQPEDERFRDEVLETEATPSGVVSRWEQRRPIPPSDAWFETAWAAWRAGRVYDP
ncbi:MAG: FAD-binding protein [Chloroflexi bacterium]|nr:FAD-binding protein [Chloroflexota bacterium]